MIRLEIPGLPPSSNHAYFNLPTGGRALSTLGRAYITGTTAHFQRMYRTEMMIFRKNVPYFVVARFYLEHLEHKGYPKKTETRYKKLDGNNRIKLLEDTLKAAGGVDDSQTLAFLWQKVQGVPERTELFVWDLEKEWSPFDDALGAL